MRRKLAMFLFLTACGGDAAHPAPEVPASCKPPTTCSRMYDCGRACQTEGPNKRSCARTCNETYGTECGHLSCDVLSCTIYIGG